MNPFVRFAIPAALILALTAALAPHAVAVPVEMKLGDPSAAPSLLPYAKAHTSADLQAVVALLGSGKRDEAKMELARFLTKHPQDARGTELAGLIFMEERNWKMAITSFQRVLATDPGRTSARSKLGVALLMEGKMEEGRTALEKAVAGNGTDTIARRYLGWMAETKGDLQGALDHYGAMIPGEAADATMSEFHALAGRLYNRMQRPDMAIRLLEPLAGRADSVQTAQLGEQVLAQAYLEAGNKAAAAKLIRSQEKRLPGTHPDLRMQQAHLALLEKDYPKARERLQAVIKDTPGYFDAASFQLARAYEEEGNWKKAAETLESLAPRTSKNDLVLVLSRLAGLRFAHGDGAAAVRTLAKYAPQDPSIHYLLAEAQARNHDYGAALRTVNELVAKSPQFAGGHYLAGMLYKHEKKPVHAEKSFTEAVRLIPAYLDAWAEWADVYAAGMPLKAEEILARGLAANPGDPFLLFRLAAIQDENGKVPQANQNYRLILKKMPNHAPALQRLALNLAADAATLGEARGLAERAYGLDRNDPAILDTYGWILVQSDDTGKGIPLLESALKSLRQTRGKDPGAHGPEDTPLAGAGDLSEGLVHYHLGAAYMKDGRAGEGATLLNRALGLGVSTDTRVRIAALLKG